MLLKNRQDLVWGEPDWCLNVQHGRIQLLCRQSGWLRISTALWPWLLLSLIADVRMALSISPSLKLLSLGLSRWIILVTTFYVCCWRIESCSLALLYCWRRATCCRCSCLCCFLKLPLIVRQFLDTTLPLRSCWSLASSFRISDVSIIAAYQKFATHSIRTSMYSVFECTYYGMKRQLQTNYDNVCTFNSKVNFDSKTKF